jgi:type I restriction enzyme R subunit
VIKDLGNLAVHSHKPVRAFDALTATRELFHVLFWLARTYARGAKPGDARYFDAELLPRAGALPPQTAEQLQRLERDVRERDDELAALLAGKTALDAEIERRRAEVAEAKRQNAARPDEHDDSEAQTRDYFVDLLLKDAGWALDKPEDREFEVAGMPNAQSKGFVDYILWGDDGRPLALVEAKRTRRDARAGRRQAELYADCLETQFGRRPIIYYSNGYEHWLWDDADYPPRSVQGSHKKDELELMLQRRETRRPLADEPVDETIVERYYQTRAIRRIGEAFERDRDRKALIIMATGAGKTRTVIALFG